MIHSKPYLAHYHSSGSHSEVLGLCMSSVNTSCGCIQYLHQLCFKDRGSLVIGDNCLQYKRAAIARRDGRQLIEPSTHRGQHFSAPAVAHSQVLWMSRHLSPIVRNSHVANHLHQCSWMSRKDTFLKSSKAGARLSAKLCRMYQCRLYGTGDIGSILNEGKNAGASHATSN